MFPPWEMASFWALGKYLKAVPESRLKWTIVLGFVVGLGAYTYVPWVFIPALVFGVLWFEKGSVMGQKIRTLLVYAGSLVVGASWFIAACLREGYGDHISALWAGKTTFIWFHHLAVIYDYFNVVFWGFAGEVPRYVPFQGGYLNPLLGALFFLGLVEAWRFRHLPFFKVLGVAFALFILPGVLSVNVQGLRIVPLMPLPLFMVALGFQRLTKAWAALRPGLGGGDYYFLPRRFGMGTAWSSLTETPPAMTKPSAGSTRAPPFTGPTWRYSTIPKNRVWSLPTLPPRGTRP